MIEFSVRYIQGSYFVVECSDCIQNVAWKLISPLKLQVQSIQVTDVSQKGQLYDPACVFQLWLVFPLAVQESANLRESSRTVQAHSRMTISPRFASVNHRTPYHSLQLTVIIHYFIIPEFIHSLFLSFDTSDS